MDYGGYVLILVLILAGVFFVLAIINRGNPRFMKFTAYGMVTLVVLWFIVSGVTDSSDLRVGVLIFLILAAIYYWLYKNVLKNRD